MEPIGRAAVIVSTLLALSGCDTPSAPTPSQTLQVQNPSSPPTPRRASDTLTGTVFEATLTGLHPLAGVPLDISGEFSSWSPRATSDRNGRYEVSVDGIPSYDGSTAVKVMAELDGYSQPCRTTTDEAVDGVLNIHLVSNALVAKTGIPSSMPIVQPTLTGRVFGLDRNPMAAVNVYVDFSGGFSSAPNARTVTDAEGRYLLCNVRNTGFGLLLNAHKYPLYSDYVQVSEPLPGNVDLELFHRP